MRAGRAPTGPAKADASMNHHAHSSRAPDRTSWSFEGCEEPISRRLYLPALEATDFRANQRIVSIKQFSPAVIAQLCVVTCNMGAWNEGR